MFVNGIKEYKLVSAMTPYITHKVNDLLKEGWVLYGTTFSSGDRSVAQVLVKLEDKGTTDET